MIILIVTGEGKTEDKEREEKNKSRLSMIEEREKIEGKNKSLLSMIEEREIEGLILS